MTVHELIAALQEMPQDVPVVYGVGEIEACKVNDEFPFGDSASPNCKFGTVVELE